MPPIRGRKLRYFAEPAFQRRVRAAPRVPPARPMAAADTAPDGLAVSDPDPLTLDALVPRLAAEGLEPLPPEGASPDAIEAWVCRFIDATARPPDRELPHG